MPARNITKQIISTSFNISGKVVRRFLRIAALISRFPFLTKNEQEVLVNVLAHSQDGAPPGLKLKIYQVLKLLRRRRRKPFGMLIVLGWKREWDRKFASLPDATQNAFRDRRLDLVGAAEEKILEEFSGIADFDGAILVNQRGQVLASGIYLENVRPKRVAEVMHPEKSQDLSSAFGFVRKVHARHLAGIAASYWLKGSTVFVVSEEDGTIRIFEGGKVIWSSIRREIEK